MKRLLLTAFALFAGCTPVIDAQLRLIDVARGGLTGVGESMRQRQQSAAAFETAERRRLDEAFDRDIRDQPAMLPAWVIEARTAYATAIDALAKRQADNRRAAERDQENIAAIDAALQQAQALNRVQLNLFKKVEAYK